MKVKSQKSKVKSQLGMSLIEILISLFIIGVLITLYAASMNVVALTKKLKNENLAYHVASKQIEELRSVAFAALPANGAILDPMLAQIPQGAGDFTVVDHPGFSGLKEITVTVTWNDGAGKQVQVKTLAGLGGINP